MGAKKKMGAARLVEVRKQEEFRVTADDLLCQVREKKAEVSPELLKGRLGLNLKPFHSLIKYLLNTYMTGILLDAGDTQVNKSDKNPCLPGVYILEGGISQQLNK